MTMAERQMALYKGKWATEEKSPPPSYLYPSSHEVRVMGVLVPAQYLGNSDEIEATITSVSYEDTSWLGLLTDFSGGELNDPIILQDITEIANMRTVRNALADTKLTADGMLEFFYHLTLASEEAQPECAKGVLEGFWKIANHEAVQAGGEIAILKEVRIPNGDDIWLYQSQFVQYHWFVYSDRSRLELIHNDTIGTLVDAHFPRSEGYPDRTILGSVIGGEFKCDLHQTKKPDATVTVNGKTLRPLRLDDKDKLTNLP